MAELGAEKAKRAGCAVAGMAASWQDRGLGKSTTIQVDFINLIASCNGRDWKVHRAAPLALPYCTVSSSSRNRRPYESERGDATRRYMPAPRSNVAQVYTAILGSR